jgi:hypothetical protein
MEYDLVTVETAGEAVYLAEGEQLGYLPHDAAVAVGWAEKPQYAKGRE